MGLSAVAGPLVAGVASLAGGLMGNRANRREAERNRQFQERMRNTQWQSAVADMQAAGINPAVAYSRGPNAAPGGSTAQQMDAVSPAISSAMQARRMQADLEMVKEQTGKLAAEKRGADAAAALAEARLMAYGVDRTPSGSWRIRMEDGALPWLTREIQAGVRNAEEGARRQELTGDVMEPLADLSKRLGEFLPILGLLSQMAPGGILRKAPVLKNKRRP